jgi:Protein of unknown function (DUF3500)
MQTKLGVLSLVGLIVVAGCSSSAIKSTGATVATVAPSSSSSAGGATTVASATTQAAAGGSTAVAPVSTTTAVIATTPVAGTTGESSAKALAAAQALIRLLDATQKTAAVVDRTPENLAKWSNFPDQIFQRAGLRLDTLTADQKKATQAVLQAALSPEGYTQVSQITTADGALAAAEGPGPGFGAEKYWIRFIGTPSATAAWTVQFGGHHLAVNISLVGTKMTLAPTLWGAQPSSYADSGATVEPLSGELSKAFALMNALDATQQKAAMLSSTKDLVVGPGQDGKTIAPEGVKSSTFTPEQKKLLLAEVQEWLRPLNAENAAAKLAAAEGELDQMTFAWSGATAVGSAVYFRVQSPTFIIEFAHQGAGRGGGAANVDHIHSMYREIGNDYGKLLIA